MPTFYIKENNMTNRICKICGKEFYCAPSKNQIFCSRKCDGLNRRVTIKQPCKVCGKEFVYNPRSRHAKYCSLVCYQTNRAASIAFCVVCGKEFKYSPNSHKGKYCSNACRKNLITQKCFTCGKEFSSHPSDSRKYCSRHCYDIAQNKGKNSSYRGPGWVTQRNLARQRDRFTCQRCGKTEKELGKHLSAHHKIPFRLFGITRYKEANQLENLVCLCDSCHHTVEHEYERNNQM
jgi:5-methylcytosine-specific restriction endonuclease McrA